MYLYRAVDSPKETRLNFISVKQEINRLQSTSSRKPRVMTVDKNPAYPIAIEQLKNEKSIPDVMQFR